MKTIKKIMLITAALAFMASAGFGQMTSKKGNPILPEAGDWSISIDAIPIVTFLGTVAYGSGGGGAAFTVGAPMTIAGKYVINANTAYRAKLRIGFGSVSTNSLVTDDASTVAGATVEDERSVSTLGIVVGAGMQKMRGKGRVKGIYGAEVLLSFVDGAGTTKYTYGNDITSSNSAPTSTFDFDATVDSLRFGSAVTRLTETKTASTIGFTLRGFIGAEYFFAPKMSVSVEYGWGLTFSSTGEGESSTEELPAGKTAPETTTGKTGGGSAFSLDNDIGLGAINLNFYF